MDEDGCLHQYGTPLEPIEKDEVPAKKPVAIEDQIVKDENGKRRFHGAFTGGFSAGFWNTVGSLEGWTPQSFKSSRAVKAVLPLQQKPEDFMDDEDKGEFGIAPQGIRTRDDFSKQDGAPDGSRKRKLAEASTVGPIPGVPVLEQLLKPVRDKAAVRILKSMGWKPGQGVGARQTRKEKQQTKERNEREKYLMQHYGCGLRNSEGDDSGTEDDDDEEITFAPDDYEPLFYAPKNNRYGLSYSGLSRAPVFSKTSTSGIAPSNHINLFKSLAVLDKNQKLAIRGQAFGVGALEEEDEDIYSREDLSRYDFSLADSKPKEKSVKHVQAKGVIDGFREDKSSVTYNEPYSVDFPPDFKPRNWALRKSRFAPLDKKRAQKLQQEQDYKRKGLGRHDLNPETRAHLLGEKQQSVDSKPQEKKDNSVKPKNDMSEERTKKLLERLSSASNNFTRGGLINAEGEEKSLENTPVEKELHEENKKLLEKAAAKTKDLDTSLTAKSFKPFLNDSAKQERYEQFLDTKLTDEEEIGKFLSRKQPITMSLWDRQIEVKEFIQARNIYKPLGGMMLDRFVTENAVKAEENATQLTPSSGKQNVTLSRTKVSWKPCSLLCKRYNIAEPYGGAMLDENPMQLKKQKLTVYNYVEASVNTKFNFQTPVIIPKRTDLPKEEENESHMFSEASQIEIPDNEPERSEEGEQESQMRAAKSNKFVPKTDLEKRVDETRDKPIDEKIDLFKSIFDESDVEIMEEEDEEEEAQTEEQRLDHIRIQLGLPPVSARTKSRYNAPPSGIFSSLFGYPNAFTSPATYLETPKPTKITFKRREEREPKTVELPENVYGPKIPEQLQSRSLPNKTGNTKSDETIADKLEKLWQMRAARAQLVDSWVEKPVSSSKIENDSTDKSESSEKSKKKSKKKKAIKHKSDKKQKKSKKKLEKKKKDKSHKHSKKTKK